MYELELLPAILGGFITVLASVVSVAYWLGRRFTLVESKLKGIEGRVNLLEKGLEDVRKGVKELKNEVGGLGKGMRRVMGAVGSQLEFFAEFLGFKGVLEDRDVEFVRGELEGLEGLWGCPTRLRTGIGRGSWSF